VIDWVTKTRDLKRMADELEMVASRLDGRAKMVLGRTADELRQFAAQIERALQADEAAEAPPEEEAW